MLEEAFWAVGPLASGTHRMVMGVDTGEGLRLGFENSYARLPERFSSRQSMKPVAAPRLLRLNRGLAKELGLHAEALASQEGVAVLAGNVAAADSEPIALAYAGHQFGNFVPQLGDGRACLLGEVVAPGGQRYDVQLKGSGPTVFSRRGDGRSALGPVLREYLVSEAMAGLGIPTTRALAAVATGEAVWREGPQPGGVLTRVAASHLRVGTFEYFAVRKDVEALKTLVRYGLERHDPEQVGAEKPAQTLLRGVIARQAELVARWMLVGFVHGVMNTDNCSISGETLDFGPCAFLEAYHPDTVFSSIDQQGRYAYSNQPGIVFWNLTRLAEALLPVMAEEEGSEAGAIAAAEGLLGGFAPRYEAAELAGWRRKLGLETTQGEDQGLIGGLLRRLAENRVDFTLFFRRLCGAAEDATEDRGVRGLFADPGAYDDWAVAWRERMAGEGAAAEGRAARMRRVNPAFIPRNHLVEAALRAAIDRDDPGPFEELTTVLERPYEDQPEKEHLQRPAKAEEVVRWTFCGT